MQQTTANLNWIVTVGLLFALISASSIVVKSQVCTRMSEEKRVKVETYLAECIHSYEEKCGWFSRKMCTFNETIPCEKQRNRTVVMYRIVESCCPGYHKNDEGTCSRNLDSDLKDLITENTSQGNINSSDTYVEGRVTVSYHNFKENQGARAGQVHDDTEDDKFFLGISPGAYAGIICGILFVLCVAILTALHYRKRKLRQAKMDRMNTEQEMVQKQLMIPCDKAKDSSCQL